MNINEIIKTGQRLYTFMESKQVHLPVTTDTSCVQDGTNGGRFALGGKMDDKGVTTLKLVLPKLYHN